MVRFVSVVVLVVVFGLGAVFLGGCADAGGAPCVAVWSSGTVCNYGQENSADGATSNRSSDTDIGTPDQR